MCFNLGRYAIVTEFVPRGNLENILLNKSIELSMCKRMQMARDVAQGVNWMHCHKTKIVHRDLKLGNLLADDEWRIKICDFGFSRTMADLREQADVFQVCFANNIVF